MDKCGLPLGLLVAWCARVPCQWQCCVSGVAMPSVPRHARKGRDREYVVWCDHSGQRQIGLGGSREPCECVCFVALKRWKEATEGLERSTSSWRGRWGLFSSPPHSILQYGAAWSSEWHLCPWQGGWNSRIFGVSPNPVVCMILGLTALTVWHVPWVGFCLGCRAEPRPQGHWSLTAWIPVGRMGPLPLVFPWAVWDIALASVSSVAPRAPPELMSLQHCQRHCLTLNRRLLCQIVLQHFGYLFNLLGKDGNFPWPSPSEIASKQG